MFRSPQPSDSHASNGAANVSNKVVSFKVDASPYSASLEDHIALYPSFINANGSYQYDSDKYIDQPIT